MTFSQTTCIEGDCQEGTGKMLIVYDDGSRCDYEGAFRYGYINGKGIFTCNEYTESGIFKNNKLIEGEYNSGGLYQRGTFVNRVLHGALSGSFSKSKGLYCVTDWRARVIIVVSGT